MSGPSLSADESHLLDGLVRYGEVRAARNDRPSRALVEKGFAEDTTPDASTMLLVLTEAGERIAKGGA